MNKFLILLVLFGASFSIAENACADLCVSCASSRTNESCEKVYNVCNCPLVLDSVNAARKSHAEEVKAGQARLLAELDASCEKKFCTRTFYFRKGVYHTLEQSSGLTSKEELAQFENKSEKKVEKPSKLSSDCKELCPNVQVDTTTFYKKDYVPTYSDPIQEKIDKSCGCYNFRRQKKLYADAQRQDSVQRFQESLQRVENEKILTDDLQNSCNGKDVCAIQMTLQRSNYKIVKSKQIKIKPSKLPKKKKIKKEKAF